jgi:invasion protein IalB
MLILGDTLSHIGSSSLLALAFALGTSLAVAQEGQPVPKTKVPMAAPAAPAATPTPEGVPASGVETGSAWLKLCQKNEQTGNKQVCLVRYEGLDPDTRSVQIIVVVRSVEGEDKQTLLVGPTTAYTLVIPFGIKIQIDDAEPIRLQFAVCFSMSCQVQMELTKEIFDKMRKGKQMIVAAMNMQQKTMGFQVPLTGFSKAFDGPPVDAAKYEEAQRQMMEKVRQRQIELANKAKEGAKPQTGTPPPQAGVQPPAYTPDQKKTPTSPAP